MHSYVVYFAVAIIHWHKKALIQRALAAWLSNLTLGVTTEQRSQHKYAAGWVISYNPSWKQLSVTGTEYIAYWIKIFCKPELQ